MIRSKLLVVIISALVGGCAIAPTAEQQARQAEVDRTVPVCTSAPDCSAKWDAAQLWIVHHASYKIQTATNVLIETFNPSNYDPGLAARVTK